MEYGDQQNLLRKIERREHKYQSFVQKNRADARLQMVADMKARVRNANNEAIDIPAQILIYNPHIPASREFHLRDQKGHIQPIQVDKMGEFREKLIGGSSHKEYRAFSGIRGQSHPQVYQEIQPIPVHSIQQSKFTFENSKTFMREVLSPTRSLTGYQRTRTALE